eukprot:scaffold410_cov267-Chaetoceros_neogracile.AAC.37
MSLQEEDTLQAQNAYDKMLTFFTGRAKHQRISRERAIKFVRRDAAGGGATPITAPPPPSLACKAYY